MNLKGYHVDYGSSWGGFDTSTIEKVEPFEKLASSSFSSDKRLKLQHWTEAEIEAESATNDKCH